MIQNYALIFIAIIQPLKPIKNLDFSKLYAPELMHKLFYTYKKLMLSLF